MLGQYFRNFFNFRASSLENPSVGLSDWDDDSILAGTGDHITHNGALRLPPFFRALDLISGDVAKLPLNVFRRAGSGKIPATTHQAYGILRYKANQECTAYNFKRALTYQALLGNAYALIERNDAGRLQGLLLLDSKKTYPVRMNGELWYVYDPGDGKRVRFERSEILHIKGLAWDGVTGHSTLEVMREALASGLATRKYGNKFFHNAARPSIVLEHPGSFRNKDIAERLRKDWDRMHRGLDNSHRIAILEEGMKVRPIGATAKDSMLIEASQFSIVEVANFFGIPPHKLGHEMRSSFSSLEQENQSYLDSCLSHWLVQIEQECRDKLLTERQKAADDHIIEFNREALIEADLKSKADFFRTALAGAPWMTIDEVRAKLNMSSLPEIGSELILPTNNFQQALDDQPEPADDQPEPADDQPDDAQRQEIIASAEAIRDQVRGRMVRRVHNAVKRVSADHDKLRSMLEHLQDNHRAVIIEALTPSYNLLRALGSDVDVDADADAIIGQYVELNSVIDAGGNVADELAKLETDSEN